MRPTSLGLFAGGGGAECGMALAGFRSLGCIEANGEACQTLRAAGLPGIQAWIGENPLPGLSVYRPVYMDLDLLWASPPCQPWCRSQTLGPKGEADTSRNGWPATLEAVATIKPRWLITENSGDLPNFSYAETILEKLRLQFKFVEGRVLNAADFGAPQRRMRWFVVAGPRPFHWPLPMRTVHITLGQALPWLESRGAMPGTSQPMYYPLDGTCGRAGTAPRWLDRPAPTVTTMEVKGTRACAASDWTFHGGPDRASDAAFLAAGRRRLTWQECAILMDFPLEWPWRGTIGARYVQIGNAVVPAVAHALGQSILKSM